MAEALLADARARHWAERLGEVLGCDEESQRHLLPLLIALHDLGKACPSFQAKSETHAGRLRDAGAPWPATTRLRYPHDLELARSMADLLPGLEIFAPEGGERQRRLFWSAVSLGVTAHHGRFFTQRDLEELAEVPATLPTVEDWPGMAAWTQARHWLVQQVRAVLCPGAAVTPCRPGNLSAVAMLLNGFTILCDWVGSDTDYFSAAAFPDLHEYAASARLIARQAMDDRRLLAYLPLKREPAFADLFPRRREARPIQAALEASAAPSLPRRSVTIIEAPMGEGKTEAALLLAQRLAWQHGHQGIYFALPTVATSNQMYDRVKGFLDDQRADTPVVLAPINGLAEFNEDVARSLRSRAAEAPAYEEEQTVDYDAWFLPRKRGLLAPYGVGTVDQALLAAMNTRHVGLRLLGLSGKVVIVDEVHAYDLYMSRILDRLLVWLRELGASVVLLSATLPARRRGELLQTFAGESSHPPTAENAAYPLITMAEREAGIQVLPCGDSGPRPDVVLERRLDRVALRAGNAAWLLEEVRAGGRAAWICNTVAEAQAVYQELRALCAGIPVGVRPDLDLFHARYTLGDRQEIEKRVLREFGPPEDAARAESPPAGRAAILVATQVIEQSLDLDFDLMVTQLAPIDLLLQRLGRLHRHADRKRPAALRTPRLVLLEPESTVSGPCFEGSGKVYSPFILLRTILALSSVNSLRIPGDIRRLIEAVYGADEDLPRESAAEEAGMARAWFAAARERHCRDEAQQRDEASLRLLGEPRPSGKFHTAQNELVDDEAGERQLAMQTRLADPSLRAALVEADSLLYRTIRSSAVLDGALARQVLLRTVSLSHWALVRWVLASRDTPAGQELTPPAFAATNALRHVVLLPLRRGAFEWPCQGRRRRLWLDDELGVRFEHEKEATDG